LIKKILFCIFFFSLAAKVVAQNGEQEANLKAAFIYNFSKYIDWGNYHHEDVFVIGVLGDSPIISPLNEIARNNTINNKRIEIRILQDLSEIRNCDMLFISKECRFSLSSVLNNVVKGVLTISESHDYATQGTDFNFVIVNQKLKFEVNLKALSTSGLKAGSQLLKLAIIVNRK
jgi:hypothetical protein